MTQVVTVRTDFADLNQMAQGLIGRVNETHVILPAGTPVDVGEWAQFAVTLLDGTPGLAGMGRCVTYVDNGEDRQAHQRFDVVFDSLQFDPRGQQIYTHILTLSGYEEDAEGADDDAHAADDAEDPEDDDGESGALEEHVGDDEFATDGAAHAADEEEEEDASDEIAYSDSPAALSEVADVDSVEQEPDDDETAEATVIAQRADLQAAIAATMHSNVPAEHVASAEPDDESVFPSEATPVATRAVVAQLNGGHEVATKYVAEAVDAASFRYANGLPFPAEPPRPPLRATAKVAPAPRPGRD